MDEMPKLSMPDPQTAAPPDPPTPTLSDKDRLDYYWKHFALIADQRVKTFNLYVVVLAATLVATIGAIRPSTPRLTLLLIGCGHMFCVFIFGMIEWRGRAIVRIGKEALRDFEASSAFGSGYKPMTKDGLGEGKGPYGLITYGNAFQLVFWVHLIFGAVIALCPSLIVPAPSNAPQQESTNQQRLAPTSVASHSNQGNQGRTTMQDVLFYTFSTIAATFGSAVGIIVAAAIFRIQRIDQVAGGLAGELLKYHPEHIMALAEYDRETQVSRLNRIVIVQHWQKFAAEWKVFHQGTPSQNYWENHLFDLLGKVIEKQERIRCVVLRLVIATLLLIGICFLGLCTTLRIADWNSDKIVDCWISINIPGGLAVLYAVCILVAYRKVAKLLISEVTEYSVT
jgi:hypothetical protein